MKIFREYTCSWKQIALIKITAACFGVAIGAYWSTFWLAYVPVLIGIGVVIGGYLGYTMLIRPNH